jgi:hypothetical protein
VIDCVSLTRPGIQSYELFVIEGFDFLVLTSESFGACHVSPPQPKRLEIKFP